MNTCTCISNKRTHRKLSQFSTPDYDLITSGYEKKVVVSQIMDYQGDIHEKIEEKSFMLKICTNVRFLRHYPLNYYSIDLYQKKVN